MAYYEDVVVVLASIAAIVLGGCVFFWYYVVPDIRAKRGKRLPASQSKHVLCTIFTCNATSKITARSFLTVKRFLFFHYRCWSATKTINFSGWLVSKPQPKG